MTTFTVDPADRAIRSPNLREKAVAAVWPSPRNETSPSVPRDIQSQSTPAKEMTSATPDSRLAAISRNLRTDSGPEGSVRAERSCRSAADPRTSWDASHWALSRRTEATLDCRRLTSVNNTHEAARAAKGKLLSISNS